MTKQKLNFVAGQRILCRDAEWLVVKSELVWQPEGYRLYCMGTDELVRGQERVFLSYIDDISIIDPSETKLIADTSAGYEFSRLFLDANLRQSPYTGTTPRLTGMGVFDPMQFQEETVRVALGQLRTRLLLADAVGLGKTIQVGMVLTELIRRGRAARILVLAKKSMLLQFQSELWSRFNIPLVRLDSEGITRLRLKVPANKNPFEIYHRVIISLDTMKNVGKYEHFLKDTHWDVVVIDEAHNVAGASVPERHLSYRLARLLSRSSDHILLTTATPHNGKRNTFGRLISLLDPSIIPDPSFENYDVEDIKGYFLMRFKEDVRKEAGALLSERIVIEPEKTTRAAENEEEQVYELLASLRKQEKKGGASRLLQYGYYKLFLSSPEALKDTLEKRLKKEDCENRKETEKTLSLMQNLSIQKSARYRLVLEQVQTIRKEEKDIRILIFTEYRKTQDNLALALAKDLKLPYSPEFEKQPSQAIATISGSTPDVYLTRTVESFSVGKSPIRILIATDVASEGVNLHHMCHHIIHYDLPWSIITLIQRNGRIDRLGQKKNPVIRYLMVETKNGLLAGDTAIFKRLIDKVEEINRLRRAGETVLNLYDAKEEEKHIAEEGLLKQNPGVLEETSSKQSETDSLNDLLAQAMLAMQQPVEQPAKKEKTTDNTLRVYSDLEFFKNAYHFLQQKNEDYPPFEKITDSLYEIPINADFRRRIGAESGTIQGYTAIPTEAIPDNNLFYLTDSRERTEESILAARNTSGYWPKTLYCNENHPLLQWLVERVLMELNRGEASVVFSPQLETGELCYCFIGQVNSKGGTPLLVYPHAIRIKRGSGEFVEENLRDVLEKTKFRNLTNTGKKLRIKAAEPMKRSAVQMSEEVMLRKKAAWEREVASQMRIEERRLKKWQRQRTTYIEEKLARLSKDTKTYRKLNREKQEIEEYIKNRREYWTDTYFRAEDRPTTKLVLLMVGG